MIASLAGTVAFKGPNEAVIEVSGVGYRLAMSTTSLSKLGAVGSDAFVFTHMIVRENEISLVGFFDEEERIAFLALIEVSGIGSKVALMALSTLSPTQLAYAVAAEDVLTLSTIPGVGKKTAARLLLELKGKLGSLETYAEGAVGDMESVGGEILGVSPSLSDAHAALSTMGFSSSEIARACAGVDASAHATEIIRYALARIGRG